jgi:hypothetical protein
MRKPRPCRGFLRLRRRDVRESVVGGVLAERGHRLFTSEMSDPSW